MVKLPRVCDMMAKGFGLVQLTCACGVWLEDCAWCMVIGEALLCLWCVAIGLCQVKLTCACGV